MLGATTYSCQIRTIADPVRFVRDKALRVTN